MRRGLQALAGMPAAKEESEEASKDAALWGSTYDALLRDWPDHVPLLAARLHRVDAATGEKRDTDVRPPAVRAEPRCCTPCFIMCCEACLTSCPCWLHGCTAQMQPCASGAA